MQRHKRRHTLEARPFKVKLTFCRGAELTVQTSKVPLTLRQACIQESPGSAMCVQKFDDSRSIAIRTTYRISLRSSSVWEPRHPLLKVVTQEKHKSFQPK